MAGLQLRKREVYDAIKAKLWLDRGSSLAHWDEIARYTKPTRIQMLTSDRTKNDKVNQNILDNTATLALDTTESGLNAGMSSQARSWFKLTVPNPKIAGLGIVQQWLWDVKERIDAFLVISNFYNSAPDVYGDVSTFGTAAMAVFEDDEDVLRCYTYPIGSFAIGINARREVDTFVLEEQFTVRQVIETFAVKDAQGTILNRDNFSRVVLDAWDTQKYEEPVEVCWIVMPNDRHDPNKLDAKYLKYTSCWFELNRREHDGVLRESGFRVFPVMAPRWKTRGNNAYGNQCPGMMILGDVKQLQGMTRKANQWIAKLIDPPVTGPSALRNQPTSLVAGHITFSDPTNEAARLRPIHELRGEGYQALLDQIARIQQRIRRGSYEELFSMLSSLDPVGSTDKTAAEVRELHDEKVLKLGPALSKMDEEFLERVIDRVYDILDANGLFPEPPEELQGMPLKVEFTSVLAEAQKLQRVKGTDRLLATLVPMGEYAPEVLDKIDFVAVANEYGDTLGTNPRLLRSDEDALARGQARAQAQQAAQEAENALKLGGALRQASQADMGTDSALTRLVQGVGG